MISSLKTNHRKADATINHIKALGFNRSTGTTGETKALIYIENELEKEGIDSHSEYFSFSGPRRLFMRLIYIIAFTYLLLFKMWLIIIAFFAIKYLFGTLRRYSLIEKEQSKNLVSRIPAVNSEGKRPVIILSAHYDSVSSYVPYKLQHVFFALFRFIMVPYLLVSVAFASLVVFDQLFGGGDPQLIFYTALYTLIGQLIVVTLVVLLIYDPKNSQGSIDNASGVAVLIELAKKLYDQPLENMDVICIWTGAEEWGMIGSKHYVKRHIDEFKEIYDLDNSFHVNFDMVGSYIGLVDKTGLFKKRINTSLNDIIDNSANELDIPIDRYPKIINPRSDHKKFRKIGKKSKSAFQIACFHSKDDSKYIHSLNDTPDKCSPEALNGCVKICDRTFRKIDRSLKNRRLEVVNLKEIR